MHDQHLEPSSSGEFQNLLRELALNVILLKNKDVNESLFNYIQFVGEFELLGEITALTMKQD